MSAIWEKSVDMNGNSWFLTWKSLCIVGIEMQSKDTVDESTYKYTCIKFTIQQSFKNEIRSIEKVFPMITVFRAWSTLFIWFPFTPLLLVLTLLPAVSSLVKKCAALDKPDIVTFGPLTRTPIAPRKPGCCSWRSSWCFPLDQDEDHWECWPPILACSPEWWKSQNSWWRR